MSEVTPPHSWCRVVGQTWRKFSTEREKKLLILIQLLRQDFQIPSKSIYPEARGEIRACKQDHQFLPARLARKRFFQIKWIFVFVAFSMRSWTTKINWECHLRLNKLIRAQLNKENALKGFESTGNAKVSLRLCGVSVVSRVGSSLKGTRFDSCFLSLELLDRGNRVAI